MTEPKKDILFIMNNLQAGGAEKALVSLLQVMDYSVYHVDLLLFKKDGVFLDKIPTQVTLLEAPEGYNYFDMPIVSAVSQCMKKGKFRTLINRILAVFVLKTEKNPAVKEQKLWKYLAPGFANVSKKYHAAVGFLEKTPNYYCIEKTNADKKILWIHTNYSNMGMEPKFDVPYFEKADAIVAVSGECAADLKMKFPQFSDKIKVIQNVVSPSVICSMADGGIPDTGFENSIMTVGRLSHEKGMDLAIEACRLLKEKNQQFVWFFIGDGAMRNELEAKVASYGLQGNVRFLGERANPYAYVAKATVYAQTSRFEGKSIAIDEAKILRKAILATNFSTVATQLQHLENGYIVEMDAQAIADGVQVLLSDSGLREKFQSNLSLEKLGTESEIEHFYQLIQ